MTRTVIASLFLSAVACATTTASDQQAWTPPLDRVCLPCPQPCTPESSCKPAKVATAPAPAPVARPAPSPAAAPSFSPAPGEYSATQRVALSSPTPGAVIHYTTDGSEPTASSPVYSEPITVDRTMTLNAIAIAPDAPASPAVSGAYTVTPPATPHVAVTSDRLELTDKVYFDTGKATIKPASYGLLDEVATALKSHDVRRTQIEGYTDSSGDAGFNKQLSQQRADAVRQYLIGKGIEADRLEAKGFGAESPVAPNTTAKGREANRRVEFKIAK